KSTVVVRPDVARNERRLRSFSMSLPFFALRSVAAVGSGLGQWAVRGCTGVALAAVGRKPYMVDICPLGVYSGTTMMEPNLKKKVVARLRRIARQVEGVARLIAAD